MVIYCLFLNLIFIFMGYKKIHQLKKYIFNCFLQKIQKFKKIRKVVAIDSNSSHDRLVNRNQPVGHP